MSASADGLASQQESFADLDEQLALVASNKQAWLNTSVAERLALLAQIKACLQPVAEDWVNTAVRKKGIAAGSALAGEEWLSGPYTLMGYCNQMMLTLSQVEGKRHLDGIAVRELSNGQVVARVLPHSIWDHLLLSGISVDVWMEPGVTRASLPQFTASAYDSRSAERRQGKLAVVLGAGNIAAIAPLDVFQKLFAENQVAVLKMNPVNDYLIDFLEPALKPLIDRGVLRIVRGGADVGHYLCNHPLVDAIHITGAVASHDAIVWGTGQEAETNKRAGTPKNERQITSELGAVCPTIVVPGPWTRADIAFQAEQVATQKLHNSGFNCVACQVLILPADWPQKISFVSKLEKVISASAPRALYYPGAEKRIADFVAAHADVRPVARNGAAPVMIARGGSRAESVEVFAPALNIVELPGREPEAYLKAAIAHANEQLYGTLGANIVIHPKTIAAIGRKRFEELLIELRYGTIAVNTWTGVGFLTPQAPWGAFPGHTLGDAQSGIGFVHNTLLFDKSQRTVVEAPFKPFPRNLLSLSMTLLPKPPWFITNRRGDTLGKLLVDFQYRPSFLKIPRIFLNALLG